MRRGFDRTRDREEADQESRSLRDAPVARTRKGRGISFMENTHTWHYGKPSDEQMNQIWTMKWDGQTVMTMPRYNVLRSVVLNHLIHHRAQVGMYLRLMNVAIPGMYGPSADEPM